MVCLHESHSLALDCKFGGRVHPKLNNGLGLIANKYHEGNVKITLERGLIFIKPIDIKAEGCQTFLVLDCKHL